MNDSQFVIPITEDNIQDIRYLTGANSRLYAQSAIACGKTVYVYPNTHLLYIENNDRKYFFNGARTPLNTLSSAQIANDKFFTSLVLQAAGLPVLPNIIVDQTDNAIAARMSSANITFPVVIKPASGAFKGSGVITDIQDMIQLKEELRNSFVHYPKMVIEKFFSGDAKDYRVLVLDDEVLGVVRRIPAYVIGDGQNTIETLISIENDARRTSTAKHPQMPIVIDTEVKNTLRAKGLNVTSIPEKNETIFVKRVCNFAAGGQVEVEGHIICPQNAQLAIQTARAMGLRLAGLDFLCTDIATPIETSSGVIIEVNSNPDIPIHGYQNAQIARDIATRIIHILLSTT